MLVSMLTRACEACDAMPLPGDRQLLTNCVGTTIAWEWARAGELGNPSNMRLYCARHEMKSSLSHMPKWLEDQLGERWVEKDFLTDVFVERQESQGDRPLLAAEVEAAPNQVIQLDGLDRGYLWDFYKLVHVRAPKLLYVACTKKGYLDHLERALIKVSLATRRLRTPEDTLAVVLLPAGATEITEVRVGVSQGLDDLVMTRPFKE
jgi:hypothetical protein